MRRDSKTIATNTIGNHNEQTESLKTALSGSGLRFRFQRDLSQKYRKYFPTDDKASRPSLEQSLHNPSEWKVLGHFDFLSITPFENLEALDDDEDFTSLSLDTAGESLECLRSSLDLALVPYKNQKPDDEIIQSLTKPGGEKPLSNPEKDPLLVIVQIILSPSIFDFKGSFDRIPKAIRHLIDEIDATLNPQEKDRKQNRNFRAGYFTTLSGPDLVIAALPKTPRDLLVLEELVQKIRGIQLSQLEKNCRDSDQEEEDDDKWKEGHACTSVKAILAFREESEGYFMNENDVFFQQEQDIDYRFHFRLRVDCGHEGIVIDDILKTCQEENWNINAKEIGLQSTWGRYSLEGSFKHLGQIVKLWKKYWFNGFGAEEERWRENHLLDGSTKISFSLPTINKIHPENETGNEAPEKDNSESSAGCHSKRVWQLHEDAIETLNTIRDQLEKFSQRFLNKRYGLELMNVYYSFRRCFFRHDLIGVARDLVPFFKQLGELFSYIELWEEYLEKNKQFATERYSNFLKDMEILLIHLDRAIRNRIEHRSVQSDPPMPHTIAHGACRILIAHSAAFWLATELFCREEGSEAAKNPPGIASDFNGCVCAGFRGQVVCNEVFAEFRQFLREKAVELHATKNNVNKNYAKLLEKHLVTLDISGRSLLQPASFFVHCLHEMAEMSDWISHDNCSELRKILNRHIVIFFSETFQKETLEAAFEYNKAWEENEAIITEILDTADRYVSYCIASSVGNELKSEGDVTNAVQKLCSEIANPVNFARNSLRNALREKTDNGALWNTRRKVEEIFGYAVPENILLLIPSVINGESFRANINYLWEINAEVMADCGMWTAFDHIFLPEFSGEPSNLCRDKTKDLNRIFCGLLAMSQASSPKGQPYSNVLSRLDHSLLYRWAVQTAALCDDGAWVNSIVRTIEEYQESHGDALKNFNLQQAKEYLENMFEAFPLVVNKEETHCLAKDLRKLKAYGGNINNPHFVSQKEFNNTEAQLFQAFRESWRSFGNPHDCDTFKESQMEFAQKLWITASQFGLKDILTAIKEDN